MLRVGSGVFVVSGYSDEEHQRQIDELIASGKAAPDSLFVCIKKFHMKNARGRSLMIVRVESHEQQRTANGQEGLEADQILNRPGFAGGHLV
jgi:hypothetical protein